MIGVAFDEDRGEASEAHNPRSSFDGTSSGVTDPTDVLRPVLVPKTVWGNERIDIDPMNAMAKHGAVLDVADRPGWKPRKDILEVLVWNGRAVRSPQHGEYIGGRSPAFLMRDERKVERHRRATPF